MHSHIRSNYKTIIKVDKVENITNELINVRQQRLNELKSQNKTDGLSEFNRNTNIMVVKWADLVSASEWIDYVKAISNTHGVEVISTQIQTI